MLIERTFKMCVANAEFQAPGDIFAERSWQAMRGENGGGS
jgi:hypothetical protein